MTRALPLALALAFATLSACSDDRTPTPICGPGEDITVDSQALCVVESAVVIETGFFCPNLRPVRYDVAEFVCCGRVADLPEATLWRAIGIYKQRRGIVDTDAGTLDAGSDAADVGVADAATDAGVDGADGADAATCDGPGVADRDGDGYCSDVDCRDDDATVNPGATEVIDGLDNDCDDMVDETDGVACVDDSDCPAGTCRDGICQPR